MPAPHRTSYLAITAAVAVAGLIVFAAFLIDADHQRVARVEAAADKELSILQHVDRELRFFLSADANVDSPEGDVRASNDTPQAARDAASNLLTTIGELEELVESDDENANAAAEQKKSEINTLLTQLSFWISDTSTITYDSLTASGDFYRISSVDLRDKLTELKLVQNRLQSLSDKVSVPTDENYVKLLGKTKFADRLKNGIERKIKIAAKIRDQIRMEIDRIYKEHPAFDPKIEDNKSESANQ